MNAVSTMVVDTRDQENPPMRSLFFFLFKKRRYLAFEIESLVKDEDVKSPVELVCKPA